MNTYKGKKVTEDGYFVDKTPGRVVSSAFFDLGADKWGNYKARDGYIYNNGRRVVYRSAPKYNMSSIIWKNGEAFDSSNNLITKNGHMLLYAYDYLLNKYGKEKANQARRSMWGRKNYLNGNWGYVSENTTAKRVATPTSTPVNYGLVGGVLKGWKGLRGVIDDQSFADLQSLGYSGERNARAAQLWMNDNLSKYLVPGAVATDNAWGELSSRALKMMMLNKANLDLAAIFTQNPVLFNSSNFKDELAALNVVNTPDLKLTPTKFNFNKALTRDWLRNNGIGPYSLTGAQRRAVKNVLAGNGTDLDRSLIGTNSKLLELLTKRGYFKQGGLISRNPVLRFKLGKKIVKALQGKVLPTAPKAEDRYKGGKREQFVTNKPSVEYDRIGVKLVIGPQKEGLFTEPALISQTVRYSNVSPTYNDTIYTESPERSILVSRRLRLASRTNVPFVGPWYGDGWGFRHSNSKDEYETLKRRFNTAWNLAK